MIYDISASFLTAGWNFFCSGEHGVAARKPASSEPQGEAAAQGPQRQGPVPRLVQRQAPHPIVVTGTGPSCTRHETQQCSH